MIWTVHKKGAPAETLNSALNLVAVAVGDKVYTMSPCPMVNRMEVRVFDMSYLRWIKFLPVATGGGKRPKRRYNHTAVAIDDVIYLWGGRPFCHELYAFDVDAHGWFKPQVSGTRPQARARHSACVLGKAMYIHGGVTGRSLYSNDDIDKLDTSTMVWSSIHTGGTLSFTADHSATVIGTNMFVFEGHSNNIRAFDTETHHWQGVPCASPHAAKSHSAVAYSGELYIFGGYINGFTRNNVWKFNPETTTWKQVKPKGKGPCMISTVSCCCMVGDRVVLFGGNERKYGHLYILDLSPSLKTLCKLAVIQSGLEWSGLPHNVGWELAAMTSNRKRKYGMTKPA